MRMDNIQIEVRSENYIVVLADTERFGKGEVMFEGNTFDQCFDYIKKETGKDEVSLRSYMIEALYTDRLGRTFPDWMMVVD